MPKHCAEKDAAVVAGLKFYFTGIPCARGHVANRYTKGGSCVVCCSEANREFVARKYATDSAFKANRDAKSNAWRRRNPDRAKLYEERHREKKPDRKARNVAAARRYEQRHPEKKSEQNKKWRQRNPEKHRAGYKRWRAKNPERAIANGRRWRESNRDKCRESIRNWNKRNPELARAMRVRSEANRRSQELATGLLTRESVVKLLQILPPICRVCGVPDNLTFDHIVALTRGGTNDLANFQLLCAPCNSSKGNRDFAQWLAKFHGKSIADLSPQPVIT